MLFLIAISNSYSMQLFKHIFKILCHLPIYTHIIPLHGSHQSCLITVFTAMRSRCWSHMQTKHLFLLILTHIIAEYLRLVHSRGHIGIIKLQHAYADLVASSRKNTTGKGLTKEHVELFKAHDRARHGRVLANVVQFPLGGSSNPFVAGIYFTRVKLGTPSKEYYVQVDTGSDLFWLNCNPCTACPRSNDLGMILVPYDPPTSSTSSPITCKDSICDHAFKVNSGCDSTRVCGYSFQYGDGSSTTGYLVADTLVYTTVQPNNTMANSQAKVVFGCGYSQSGNLLTAQNVVDGIIGFGQSKLSVISQLYSQELTPGAFAHCLQGSEKGGGILVLGNIVDLAMVYTPIIPSQPHYNVNLRSISVGGTPLLVDSSAYETTNIQGTIFDSGTTLAYLMEPVYTSFINAIIKEAPNGARVISEQGSPCFIYTGSVDDAFPLVTLHFEGGDMTLRANHYLIEQADVNPQLWCIGWHPISTDTAVGGGVLTILGDIVLKDQLVVYDLENQRIGWANYDCSGSIAVSTTSGKSESVSSHELRNSAALPHLQLSLLTCSLLMLTCIHFLCYS